ncbi:hypothetical protein [Rhodoluna sp. KAS3]|uniref:hypothetical protein n=1 Tax=Rhodoluna sp. KAS3 TaxID=942880 RepID=UPI00222F9B61|nr:hypothetical protein [Rhodoluna sp. KAS3]BDS48659.1 hypothetical protein RKAS3_02360 [Rhodoluna sp. KAS3]
MKIVYTAMHGVGWHVVEKLFAKAGLARLQRSKLSCYPMDCFLPLAFPNPEEPGAMDLSFALARSVDADLIWLMTQMLTDWQLEFRMPTQSKAGAD